MSKADEPAFPIVTATHTIDTGLTKREYSASAALQGMMANGDWTEHEAAVIAVDCADALIAALERKPE
jgi:hypothetical protein